MGVGVGMSVAGAWACVWLPDCVVARVVARVGMGVDVTLRVEGRGTTGSPQFIESDAHLRLTLRGTTNTIAK